MAEQDYEIRWKEDHFAEVTAANETEAFERAADYAQGHDTRVDEDEYECRLVDGEPDEEEQIAVIREFLNMQRIITVNIRGTTVVINDYLKHPIESYSRSHKTVMDTEILEELIENLGYVKAGDDE